MDHQAWSLQAAPSATISEVAVLLPIKQQQPTGSSEDCHSRHLLTPVSSHLRPEHDPNIEAYIGQSSNPMFRPSTEHDHEHDADTELDDFFVLQDDLLRGPSGAAQLPNNTVEVQQQFALENDHHSSQQGTSADSTEADLSQQPVPPKSATATEGALLHERQQHRQKQRHLNGSVPASTAETTAVYAVPALQQAHGQHDPVDIANHQQRQQQQLITMVLEPLGPPMPCSRVALASQIVQRQQQHQPVRLLGPFTITNEAASPCKGEHTYQAMQQMTARSEQQQLQWQQLGCQQLPLMCPLWQDKQQLQQQQAPSMVADRTDALLSRTSTSAAMAVPDIITADVYLRAHTALQRRLQAAYQAGYRDGTQHALQQEAANQQQHQRQYKHQQHKQQSCSKRPLQTSAGECRTKKARSVSAKSAPVLSELLALDRESAETQLSKMSDNELWLLAAQMVMQKCPSEFA